MQLGVPKDGYLIWNTCKLGVPKDNYLRVGSNIFENLACHHWGNTQTHYRYPEAVGQSDYLQLESQRKTCVRGVQE